VAASTVPAAVDLGQLRSRLDCPVIGPDDASYDTMRVVMAGHIDARPAAIVRPRSDSDVAAAVSYVAETGVAFAVRGGGHSGAGHSTVEGGVVVDLRDMRACDLDVDGRTVWAEAGLTALDVTAAAAEHGLAIGFGDTGSVGIGGLTLGGGVGYLGRKHGLTIDNLLAADVVTADGKVRRVDADNDADLFWAIRGGGGNFGIVTRFHYRLQPVSQVYGGLLVLPATAGTVAGFVAAAEAAPDDLTTIANVMSCPPLPFVDEAHHGEVVVLAMACWSGDVDRGEAALAPFTSLAPPLADMLGPMPYPQVYPPDDPDYRPTAAARTMFVDSVGEEEAAEIVARLAASDAMMRVVQLRVLGGAIAAVPADATAYAHRASRIMANVAAFYDGPEDKLVREAWVDETVAALQQQDGGAYVNFVGDEGPERVRAAYPGATWDRLRAVKAAYDPGNLFARNQNIPPAA
jgi:FAD/FMN-containing dehydrogenase